MTTESEPLTPGDVLVAIRGKRRWSQEDLARVVGIERSTITRIENGTRLPSKANLSKIVRHADPSTAERDALISAGLRIPPKPVPPGVSRCAVCGGDTDVIETRRSGEQIRRRRACVRCGERFTTYETRDKEPWGVYVETCASCGASVGIVATVEGVSRGTVAWYADPRCTACKEQS